MRIQRIEVMKDGGYVSIKPEEFLTLPLAERLAFILQRAIRFYDGAGSEIPLQEGSRILREHGGATPRAPESTSVPWNGDGRVSLSKFMELPLDRRLPMLLDGRVFFRDPRGAAIPLKLALQIMQDVQDGGFVEATYGRIAVEASA